MSLSTNLSESTVMSDLLGAITQPVYVKNAEHQWIYINAAGAELLSLSPEAIVGRCEADFLPSQVARQLRGQDEAFFAEKDESANHPLTINGYQMMGHRRLISVEGKPALLNSLEDVTAVVQAQQENASLAQALKSNQAELKTALLLEETLKRITDRVRDSPAEQQLFQAPVAELVDPPNAKDADTAIPAIEPCTPTQYDQSAPGINPLRGQI